MKILAFNSSPSGKKGATEVLLSSFLKGARDAGAATETVYLHNAKINKCTGCFTCWEKTPGKCMFRDDMDQLLPKFRDADFVVFGTPLYHFTMTASMKKFVERTIPLGLPFIKKKGRRSQHPMRYPESKTKWVVISPAGFPDMDHFKVLDETFEMIAANYHTSIVGKIYRPASGLLYEQEHRRFMKSYLELCYDAGREVAKDGKVSFITQKKLMREVIIPKFIYRFFYNHYHKKNLKRLEKSKKKS